MNIGHVYIEGQWVAPEGDDSIDIINPATEETIGSLVMCNNADLNKAVTAARRAFDRHIDTPAAERQLWLERIIKEYERRSEDLAVAVHLEMGAPLSFTRSAHVPGGLGHLNRALDVLKTYAFEEQIGTTWVTREAIGVCGLITPWNWPLNQITCKIGPAIATGCSMILKPSEYSPVSAKILAEIIDAAAIPAGVFNMLFGAGQTVGEAMSRHPDIDMISFTGSTRAGVAVAKGAAETVKRVTQELGGKSANILLDDAKFAEAVRHGVMGCFKNTGQSCNAPTRLLVPEQYQEEVIRLAQNVAQEVCFDDSRPETSVGPVANALQFERVQQYISDAIGMGARLVVGGTGRPEAKAAGYYIKPTIFADVTPDQPIAREEVFGPVLCIMPYKDIDQAVAIANDTPYGLSGYVTSSDIERAQKVARRLRTGMVHLNGCKANNAAPFGGYKQSGNGREWGRFGFEDFLEVKSIFHP